MNRSTDGRLRWGIIGTGWIAGVFAEALGGTRHGVKQAVASRTSARAQEFAAKHGVARAHGSYGELFADPEVDAVYISTPHPVHCADVLAAVKAGKHVLCEKPLGVTAAECRRMVVAAKRAGVVLLEAFMYRTHPQTLKLQELVASGVIGRVSAVRSVFTFDLSVLPITGHNVRLDPALRGGSLYDVGGYCINVSRMLAGGEPDRIEAVWRIDPASGVDEACAAVLHFPSGVVAHFDVSLRSAPSNWVEVVGSKGRIVVPSPWWPDRTRAVIQLHVTGRDMEEVVVADGGWIFGIEADHLADVIAGRAKPLIPAENAIGTARVLETIWDRMHPSRQVPAQAKVKAKPKPTKNSKAKPHRR